MAVLAMVLASLFILAPRGHTAPTAPADVRTTAPADLARGRWGLLFVVLPGCPACEQALTWFSALGEESPEIQFAVVAPTVAPELTAAVPPPLRVLADAGGTLGGRLGVKRAPTLVLLVEGSAASRLDWPFTEAELTMALSSSPMEHVPSPHDLLGNPAPGVSGLDLAGNPAYLSDLPRPLLLVFFNPGCPPCWDALPELVEVSKAVAVALLAIAPEGRLHNDHPERLAQFVYADEGYPRLVVLIRDPMVPRAYHVTRTPAHILVDETGVIAWVADGLIPQSELLQRIRAALGERE